MKKGYYKKRNRFINPHIACEKRSFFDIILWQLGFYNDIHPLDALPRDFQYPNVEKPLNLDAPQVTWMNHSTFLVKVGTLHLLTDPIWSERCSPFSFLGPRRLHPVPLDLKELPPIDLVLLSHDHYDHFDKQTLLKLLAAHPGATWVVPLGLRSRLRKLGMRQIIEMEWWEDVSIGLQSQEIVITAVPAQHFSGRGLFDKNRTLWSGFVLDFLKKDESRKRLYFVGDTGYNAKDFKAIGEQFKGMDLSLIPIGTYIPRAFMSPVHISPEQAIVIHQEVASGLSIGMHWQTFRLSGEPLERPPYDLYCALKRKNIDPSVFRILRPGQTINW